MERLKLAKEHKKWIVSKIGIKCCGLMSPSLNGLPTSEECMFDGGRGAIYKNECLLPTVKHGGGSIMVWSAISA